MDKSDVEVSIVSSTFVCVCVCKNRARVINRTTRCHTSCKKATKRCRSRSPGGRSVVARGTESTDVSIQTRSCSDLNTIDFHESLRLRAENPRLKTSKAESTTETLPLTFEPKRNDIRRGGIIWYSQSVDPSKMRKSLGPRTAISVSKSRIGASTSGSEVCKKQTRRIPWLLVYILSLRVSIERLFNEKNANQM